MRRTPTKRSKQLPLALIRHKRPDGLPAISLFSGAGGLDTGIEDAAPDRIRFCSWVEVDPDCQQTLVQNNPHIRRSLFGDISSVSPSDIMRTTGLERDETFVIVGGPPCQAFSTAGLRRSINEGRGRVVDHYFALIRALRPRFFVFENVRGLLSVAIQHRRYADRIANEKAGESDLTLPEEQRLGSVFQNVLLTKFERLGYEVVYGLVNAADYGTAQIRHRLVLIGSRDRELGSGRFRKMTGRRMTALDLLPPTHHQFAPYPPLKLWRTLRDSIGHLATLPLSPADTFSYSPERAAIWRRIPPGTYWTFIRDNPRLFPEGLEQLLKGAFTSGGGKVGFWRRLSWDRPSPTLPTQPQHLATGLCHPDYERPLSVPEYAALQDFPPTYRFFGNKASRYVQIGNAVPVRLGHAIGKLLLAVAGHREAQTIEPAADDGKSDALGHS